MAREPPGGDARGLFDTRAGFGARFEEMVAALTEEELLPHRFVQAGTTGTEGSP